MTRIAIIDYGLANIRSVANAIECFNIELIIAKTGIDLKKVDKIVLPGVGSFDAGMKGIKNRGHADALHDFVIENKKPFLGICLGLQFLFEGSEEGEQSGLGWIPGICKRFPSGLDKPKVPHIGWNDIEIVMKDSRFFFELKPPMTFYFVHSYYAPYENVTKDFTAATCNYGIDFTAAIEKDNIFATQFHPEKSQLAGMKLLETFLEKL